MSKGLKTLLIVLGVVVVAAAAYFFISNGSAEPSTGLVANSTNTPVQSPVAQQSSSVSSDIGREFVSILLNLQTIDLDTTLFSNPAYILLENRTLNFEDIQTNGRPNPFAPIGTDVVTAPIQEEAVEDNSLNQGGGNAAPFDPSNPFGGVDADADA